MFGFDNLKKENTTLNFCFNYHDFLQNAIEQCLFALASDFTIVTFEHDNEKLYMRPNDLANLVIDMREKYIELGSPKDCTITLYFSWVKLYQSKFVLS